MKYNMNIYQYNIVLFPPRYTFMWLVGPVRDTIYKYHSLIC